MARQENIILVVVDQWRGDCLSVAGHPVVRTPFLDAVALRGARFRRAYSATPTCIPARVALHTGLSARHHGRVGYKDGVPWDYPVTLGGEFSKQGFQTHAIGKMHAYPERHRLGFDHVVLHDGYLRLSRARQRDFRFVDDYLTWLVNQPGEGSTSDYTDDGLDPNGVVARPWPRSEQKHPTNWVVTQAIDFLYRRDPTVPFFLYLGFHRPHPPYDPPAWAFEQYLAAPPYEPVVGDWADMFESQREDLLPDASVGQMDQVTLHRARAGYYGNMAHIDQQVNRLLVALREFGIDDSCWVCFTSDHGELLGDHHLFRKSLPYEGSACIPLLLKGPPGSGIEPGTVCDQVIELRDVMPTLLDCAGLDVPGELDGSSFLPSARGLDTGWRPWLHGEHTLTGGSVQWLCDGRDKYIWYSQDGREQLFDLIADPQERHDLALDPASEDRLSIWRGRLVAELADREEGYSDGRCLVTGREPAYVLGDRGGLSGRRAFRTP